MTYSDAIKNGFRIVNKNWQLVLIQFGMMLVNCIGFFVFVGIPLAVAFVIFGLDFTEMTELKNLLGTMKDASEIITKYLGFIIVLVVSFVVYLFVAASVGLYVFGGSAGMIGRAVRDSADRFNMNTFFRRVNVFLAASRIHCDNRNYIFRGCLCYWCFCRRNRNYHIYCQRV